MSRLVTGLFAAAALAGLTAGFALPRDATPAFARAAEPSPVVSVTTLPALPTPRSSIAAPQTAAPAIYPTAAPAMTQPPSNNVAAPPGSVIEITGAVGVPTMLTLKELQRLQRSSLTLRVADADGRNRFHTFTGATLRDVIALAQPRDVGGLSTSKRAYALVWGVSGSPALVAFPEFESDFNGKTILLAYIEDARAPAEGIAELVVQGDATRGRFIKAVTKILVVDPGG
jgi:DMSO/TMAO reductase YedYZ molybdopterin-dependent catalytic subunit